MINTVLLVDDNNVLLDQIQSIVSDAGYQTIAARSGKEALKKAQQYKPDLVFLDIVMAGMNGYSTCRELKKNNDLPVIFVSSKDRQVDMVWAHLQGADGYITKPYSADEIIDTLSKFRDIKIMTSSTVLLVDDSVTLLKQITDIVSSAGYQTLTAQSGKEALEKADKFKPDLILLDIMMPDMDGYATCRELKSITSTKDIPVIFVSSKDQQTDKVWAQIQGGDAYITKPYTASEIIKHLTNILSN